MDEWLYDLGARTEDVILVRHAAGELITNVVEHAYGTSAGEVRVQVECTGRGSIEVEVTDDGHWREHAPDPDRGRGLAMASDFADDLHIATGSAGTTATVRQRMTRPARLLSARDVTPPPTPAIPEFPELLLILDQPSVAHPASAWTARSTPPPLTSCARNCRCAPTAAPPPHRRPDRRNPPGQRRL